MLDITQTLIETEINEALMKLDNKKKKRYNKRSPIYRLNISKKLRI